MDREKEKILNGMFGAHLKLLRTQKGWSQSYLGERMGLSSQQIQKYEKGNNRISLAGLFFACKCLEISMIEFLQTLHHGSIISDELSGISSRTNFVFMQQSALLSPKMHKGIASLMRIINEEKHYE